MPIKPKSYAEEPTEPNDTFDTLDALDAIDPFAAATRAFDCLKGGHSRLPARVFGTVTVTRTAGRGKDQTGVHPADTELPLSAGSHSHGLRRLTVPEAVRGSYDQAEDHRSGSTRSASTGESCTAEPGGCAW